MEVFDYQEFTTQDFFTADSQNIFNLDTNNLPKNITKDWLESYESNSYSDLYLSEQRLEKYTKDSTEKMRSWKNKYDEIQNPYSLKSDFNYSTVESFVTNDTNYLPSDNLRIKENRVNGHNENILGDVNNSFLTTDTLMSNGEALSTNGDRQLMRQSNPNNAQSDSLLENSDFSEPIGRTNWIVGKTGKVRQYDRNVESVAFIKDVPGEGEQMYLKLPQEAKINYEDQLSIFQDVSNLETDKVYSVEAKVKWLNPENKLPSAIVSFWAKNPDNSFRGKDFIITDGDDYQNIQFDFTPTQLGTTRFFLGLFTHVNGNIDDTEIYVDDYQVTEIGNIATGLDTREGNLLSDGGFDNYNATNKSFNQNGWTYTAESPVPGLKQLIKEKNQNEVLRLKFPKAEINKDQYNTSAIGVYQNVDLVGGQSYELSADFQRIKLDRFGSRQNSLVQLIAYRRQENGEELFLGPIDVELTNNRLVSKSFNIIAPDSGQYTILARLAGWGNAGNGMVVDVDNINLSVK